MADSVQDAAAPPAPPEAHESAPEQAQVSISPPGSPVESTLASESQSAPSSASAEAPDATTLAQRLVESDALAEHGVQLCRKALWRDAIDPLRRATELNPAHRNAHYYLGDAFNHTDQLAAALEAFEAAAKVDSENWRALKGIGIVLDRMRRPEDASVAYQRAREVQQSQDQDQNGSGS
jgi:tetratricopeptide (TPR) repeat protein